VKVAFRADASNWIGSGHIMRCATIANFLKNSNVEIHFICRKLPGDYIDWLFQQKFNVHILSESKSPYEVSTSTLKHAPWLGVSISQEQEDTSSVLSEIGSIDWLVVLSMIWQIESTLVIYYLIKIFLLMLKIDTEIKYQILAIYY